MGRKKLSDRPVDRHFNIPMSIAVKVDLLLADPLTGKPKHGAWSTLVTRLLNDWLEKQKKPQ